MNDTSHLNREELLKTCAMVILIVSLLLAGRNAASSNDRPSKSPVHSVKDHNLQVGDA